MRTVLSLAFVVLIAGCGTEICVGGLGDCSQVGKTLQSGKNGKGTSTTTGVLSWDVNPPTEVVIGQRIPLVVRGGQGPFSFELEKPAGVAIGNVVTFTDASHGSGEFLANAGSAVGDYKIIVRHSGGFETLTWSFVLKATP